MEREQFKILIKGVVQGIGFRPFIFRLAQKFSLLGYVKNTSKGVEIVLDGKKEKIKAFLKELKRNSPPLSNIKELVLKKGKFGKFSSFSIVSSFASKEKIFWLPPDIGICENCLKEINDKKNRRFNFWFITCTHCGPRFTILKKFPYDRENTTMAKFKLCKGCEKEYKDPFNLRFHAQTIACKKCGPKILLLDNKLKKVKGDPIEKAKYFLEKGKIIAIKGIGGYHLACLAEKDEIVKRLREKRKFSDKPFAVMVLDIKMAKSFTKLTQKEEKILKDWQKPIVLLKKSKNYKLSKFVSPKLHNIGVMLPYTGLHYLLLKKIKKPLIMTSANLPSAPTIIDDKEAFEKLKKIADYFLVHNREISQRCDDSVIKVINGESVFLRRSRGFVPLPFEIDLGKEKMVAFGAEFQNTFSIYDGKKRVFVSQYMGDISNYESFLALKKSFRKFSSLLGIKKFDKVFCDFNENFFSSKFAKNFASYHKAKLIKVQHHIAHLCSCMAEYGLKEAIGIVCDGFGLGLDKKAWGGEVILIKKGKIERVGHLEYQPLISGDMAVIYPLRIVVAILAKVFSEKEILKLLKGKEKEKTIKIWLKQLKEKENVIESSSCGRFLDAVSAFLGICKKRTYEGEPAMKLESLALKGKRIIELPLEIEEKKGTFILKTTPIFKKIVEYFPLKSKEDLALSLHFALCEGLAEIVKLKNKENLPVCFSGGVAFNELFNKFLKEKLGKIFIQKKVSPGDGGISLGQLYFNKFLI